MEESFFEQARQEKKQVVLYFRADWCGTCPPVEAVLEREIMPRWGEHLLYVKVDVHQRPDLVERYHILSVPTVLLFPRSAQDFGFPDQVLWRRSGVFPREELEAVLRR